MRLVVAVDSLPQSVIGVRVSASVFPSVIGLHVSRLSLVLSGSHAELQLSQRHSVSPTTLEILQDVPPFSTSNGICFSRKNSSIASAVRIS